MKTFVWVLLFLSVNVASAQNVDSNLDSLFGYCHHQLHFNGAVLIASDDKVVFEKCYGKANFATNTAITSGTRFRLGSLSKQFTAFVIIKLAEEKKLSLAGSAFAYLGLAEPGLEGISIHNLLSQTSGLADYTTMQDFDEKKRYDRLDILKMITHAKTAFPPGAQYSYSNSNYFVLALIAEKVTGMAFDRLLQELILTPAGMHNSGEEAGPSPVHDLATAYVEGDGSIKPAAAIEMANTVGGGGMYSTVTDMLLWSRFFQKELARDTFLNRLIFSPGRAGGHYIAGWFVNGSHLFHDGHINGFANLFSIDTATKRTIVILSNTDFRHLYISMLSAEGIPAGIKAPVAWTGDPVVEPGGYAGKYKTGDLVVNIIYDHGRLYGETPAGRIRLKYFAADEFYFDQAEGFILFEREPQGRVTGLNSFQDYEWVLLNRLP